MQFIDLSLPLEDDRGWSPWWARTRVAYQSHRFGQFALWVLFGLGRRHLRTGTGWANETLRLSTHGTTHVDAPWHYGPTCQGRPARTIDQLPLEWFHGPGVILDVRHLPSEKAATVADLEGRLREVKHSLRPGDIVLIQTGNDRYWGTREYFQRGPGVSGEATRWLVDQGVRLTGIDAWGWDGPLARQAADARSTGRRDIFWAAHYVGTEVEYCHMERLAHLDRLPPKGFTVSAFPLKVKNGSAGPARVIALLED